MVVPNAKAPLTRPPQLYPQRLAKQNNENQFKKFIDMMKSLSINVTLVEALKHMPGYAKFMKDLLEDPGAFTMPSTTGSADFAKALCDLGASINLMPYSVFKTLGIGQPRHTSMRLQMEDMTMKRPLRIIDNVLVRVTKFILPANFVILDCEVDYEQFVIEVIVEDTSAVINVEDPLEAVLLNHDVTEDEGLVEYVNALQRMGSYIYEPRKLSLDLENRKTPPANPSIEEPPVLELKPLPSHLR
ncbi:uncharacterized protein [Nicotiana sylvestris]|uniref:uncharacterized protein n=1 Tax=Nicotiana sylvestris TaxID=4096 RepID=UPI00388CB947